MLCTKTGSVSIVINTTVTSKWWRILEASVRRRIAHGSESGPMLEAPSDTHSLESLPAATLSLISIALPYVTFKSASSISQCIRVASVKIHCGIAAICLPTSHSSILTAGLPLPFAGPAVQTKTPLKPQCSFALSPTAHGSNF
jgi:hypothetical protein